jgi:eukaryotic-like serine/threonine-protein kinase
VGDYIKKRRLGRGCFGEVWLARHEGFAADFAVKFVPEANIVSPTEFYREPRLLKLLEHPNIVKVHDTGRLPNGDLFIAMEYLKRGSLASELRGDTLNLRALKQIFCGAMRGLQFAHDKDYIHRDIKPANILVADDMSGKLGDFGLVTKLGPGGTASPQFYYTYVAPEVLGSGTTTKISDVYAMAVTLYEALNGKSYLPSPNSLDDLKQMIAAGSFPDRAYYRLYIPKKLRSVINKAMSVVPSERFKSAEEFRHALEQVPIRASCKEQMSQRSFDWDSRADEERLRVSMLPQPDGKWQIETSRQTIQGAIPRRVTRLCLRNLTETQARKAVHRITSGFISGGSVSRVRAS